MFCARLDMEVCLLDDISPLWVARPTLCFNLFQQLLNLQNAKHIAQVGGANNTVSEVDLVPEAPSETNPYLNCFKPVETVLRTETEAVRVADQSKARAWKISNPTQINSISGEIFRN